MYLSSKYIHNIRSSFPRNAQCMIYSCNTNLMAAHINLMNMIHCPSQSTINICFVQSFWVITHQSLLSQLPCNACCRGRADSDVQRPSWGCLMRHFIKHIIHYSNIIELLTLCYYSKYTLARKMLDQSIKQIQLYFLVLLAGMMLDLRSSLSFWSCALVREFIYSKL